MRAVTLFLILLTFLGCHKPQSQSSDSTLQARKIYPAKGYECGNDETRMRFKFDYSNLDTEKMKLPFKNKVWITGAYDYVLETCVNMQGDITLRRVEKLFSGMDTANIHYSTITEPGPHVSIRNALENGDYSKIEFRAESEEPNQFTYIKGWKDFLSFSTYDTRKNDPMKSLDETVYVGRLVVDNGEWQQVYQQIDFSHGYLRLKYKYQHGFVANRYIFESAEILDNRYQPTPQNLNVTKDWVVKINRHGGDWMSFTTPEATYTFFSSRLESVDKKTLKTILKNIKCQRISDCGTQVK